MLKSPTTKEVIKACRLFQEGKDTSPPTALYRNKRYSEKATLHKMQKLVDRGILEYGISLRTAWVAGEQEYEPTKSNQSPPAVKRKKKRKKEKEEIY